MKNVGKQFEEDFANSVPPYVLLYRIKDTAQSYNNSENTKFTKQNPCDYFLFDGKTQIFYPVELKTTKSKSFTFQVDEKEKTSKMIKYHQVKSLTDFSRYDGVIAGFFFNFRFENEQITYFQRIEDYNNMTKTINKKSFDAINLLQFNAVKINGAKKRVHYTWDLDSFLKSNSKENK